MKRFISLLLAAMFFLNLSGCLAKNTPGSESATDDAAQTSENVTTAPDGSTDTSVGDETDSTSAGSDTEVITEPSGDTESDGTADAVTEPSDDTSSGVVTEADTEPDDGKDLAASFTVSKAFGDGMVIQRNAPIRIWGWAPESEEGRTVCAEIGKLSGSAVVTGGEWEITLDGTLKENTKGQTLTVYGAGNAKKEIRDVLVGDVYWVAGQSNAAYAVSQARTDSPADDKSREVPIDNSLLIRLNRSCFYLDVPNITRGTNEVCKDVFQSRGWQKPAAGASDFSAIGYFTAYIIYEKLDEKVPIGLIEFDGNGLPLHCFLPNEVRDALGVSTLKDGIYTSHGVNEEAYNQSSFIYNQYIYSFRRMAISGLIWYQGESDCQDINANNVKYTERFAAFVKYLRDTHDLPEHDYPVYYVEFPPIYMLFDFARVRQTMGSIPTAVPNAHVVTTADLWKDRNFGNQLHPYNKWAVSERLASIMLANQYNIGNPEDVEGPSAVSCSFSSDGLSAVIKFRNVGGGLKINDEFSDKLIGLGVITSAGGQSYVAADAEITGPDEVTVRSDKKIFAVGYNNVYSASFPEDMNLCSGTGIPCAAFRFDA